MEKKTEKGFLWLFLVFVNAVLLFFFVVPVFAELKALSNKEMRSETAQAGLASFSQSENTIRMFMDIHLETWTEIASAKVGYYESGGSLGWDQNWQNVQIGASASDPMKMDGFVFKADFNDLQTSSKPTLKRLVIGTNRLVGTMSADINSFTGTYNPRLTDRSSTAPPVIYNRQALSSGNTTHFTFKSGDVTSDIPENKETNEGFFLIITPPSSDVNNPVVHPGIQVVAGYNEINILNISSPLSTGEWWNK